jgi:DNA-binding Lrp family transcriptional regulator
MKPVIDEKDWKIINILKDHGEYTTRQIARQTLLPITTVHHRIRRLREEGVIRKFTIELDPVKTGKSFLVYVLISANLETLKAKSKTQYSLADEIRKHDFVEKVDIVSGGTDLVATVRVKDVHEFDQILLQKLQIIEGIEKTQSLIVIH